MYVGQTWAAELLYMVRWASGRLPEVGGMVRECGLSQNLGPLGPSGHDHQ